MREEEGGGEGEYGGIWGEERNADYGGMVPPSQQHVAPCVEGVEWVLGTRGLRMVVAFWAGILVEATQEAGIVQRFRRAAIGTPFQSPNTARKETVGVFYPSPTVGD